MYNRASHLFVVAALLLSTALLPAASNALQTSQSPPQSEVHEIWRKTMMNTRLPKNGCFKANFPKREWSEVACFTKPVELLEPQLRQGSNAGGGINPDFVGFTTDWSAVTSGLYTWAEGSFTSVTPGITETASSSNAFSLQLNTNTFTNSATNALCLQAGLGTAGSCVGFVQFTFQNNAAHCPACVSIWYWLDNYNGTTCPPGWTINLTDCYLVTTSALSTPLTIADLANLTLTAQTMGGTDSVILGSTDLTAMQADSTLNLSGSWNTAEFNVFGEGDGDEANFSSGTTIVVKTSVNDGTGNPPACKNESFTGEMNNLNLADITSTSTQVCCSYGAPSQSIQFMETNAGHTATCGGTQLLGDPHITTADGTHYNFQGAGEFVSLRDRSGGEVQTRQKPIPTTFTGSDPYDGLSTCVSLNSAVAARVNGHRVTWEPNLSGVPDPTGLQLRIDGVLTILSPHGVALGMGARVLPAPFGSLQLDFPDGKTLLATPEWWSSQNQWYLNVEISNPGLISADTPATGRGIAGALAKGSWLPSLPGGGSLGPMPPSLPQRYLVLYKTFADAWRVNDKDTLFDYAPGTSTDTFTDKHWPPENSSCAVRGSTPVEPAGEVLAASACRRITEPNSRADCTFDVRATGNLGFARTYLKTQRILADSTTASVTSDPDPSQAGEWITFTAFIVANSSGASRVPSGTVQFAVDGVNAGEPVTVDARGRAKWETPRLKAGAHRITASYAPDADSVFLPSTSEEKLQTVRRCFCDADHARD